MDFSLFFLVVGFIYFCQKLLKNFEILAQVIWRLLADIFNKELAVNFQGSNKDEEPGKYTVKYRICSYKKKKKRDQPGTYFTVILFLSNCWGTTLTFIPTLMAFGLANRWASSLAPLSNSPIATT